MKIVSLEIHYSKNSPRRSMEAVDSSFSSVVQRENGIQYIELGTREKQSRQSKTVFRLKMFSPFTLPLNMAAKHHFAFKGPTIFLFKGTVSREKLLN